MMAVAGIAAACACAAAAVLVALRRKAAAAPRGVHAADAKSSRAAKDAPARPKGEGRASCSKDGASADIRSDNGSSGKG